MPSADADVDAILASFTEEEVQSFKRELERRLVGLVGREITKTMKAKIVRIIVEEVEMVLQARGQPTETIHD